MGSLEPNSQLPDFSPDVDKLREAWSMLASHITIIGAVAISFAVVEYAIGAGLLWIFGGEENLLWAIISFISTTVIAALEFCMLTYIFYTVKQEQPIDISKAGIVTLYKVKDVLIATLLTTVYVLIGFLMLVIPGFIRIFRYIFINYLVFFDNKPFQEARAQSTKMTEGKKAKIAITLCVAMLPALFVAMLSGSVDHPALQFVGRLLVAVLSTLTTIVIFLFFMEARNAGQQGNTTLV